MKRTKEFNFPWSLFTCKKDSNNENDHHSQVTCRKTYSEGTPSSGEDRKGGASFTWGVRRGRRHDLFGGEVSVGVEEVWKSFVSGRTNGP